MSGVFTDAHFAAVFRVGCARGDAFSVDDTAARDGIDTTATADAARVGRARETVVAIDGCTNTLARAVTRSTREARVAAVGCFWQERPRVGAFGGAHATPFGVVDFIARPVDETAAADSRGTFPRCWSARAAGTLGRYVFALLWRAAVTIAARIAAVTYRTLVAVIAALACVSPTEDVSVDRWVAVHTRVNRLLTVCHACATDEAFVSGELI